MVGCADHLGAKIRAMRLYHYQLLRFTEVAGAVITVTKLGAALSSRIPYVDERLVLVLNRTIYLRIYRNYLLLKKAYLTKTIGCKPRSAFPTAGKAFLFY